MYQGQLQRPSKTDFIRLEICRRVFHKRPCPIVDATRKYVRLTVTSGEVSNARRGSPDPELAFSWQQPCRVGGDTRWCACFGVHVCDGVGKCLMLGSLMFVPT